MCAGMTLAALSGAAAGVVGYPDSSEGKMILEEGINRERIAELEKGPMRLLADLMGLKYGVE